MNNEAEYYERFGGLSCSEPDDKPSESEREERMPAPVEDSDPDDKPS